MELRHLRYVVAVADELNFSRAAERLNMSQPPLSQQVRDFEDELGVQIFHRTKRKVDVTTSGVAILDEARRILERCDHLKRVAHESGNGHIGRLAVAAMCTERAIVVRALREFSARHPAVAIRFSTMDSDEQIASLRAERIDVGFVRLPVVDETLGTEVVQRTPLVVGLPAGHPLSARCRVSVTCLIQQPLTIHAPADTAGTILDQLVASGRGGARYEVTDVLAAISMVAAGLGVALLPASVCETKTDGVVFRELDAPLMAECGVVYSRDRRSEVVDAFLRMVRVVAREGQLEASEASTPRRTQVERSLENRAEGARFAATSH